MKGVDLGYSDMMLLPGHLSFLRLTPEHSLTKETETESLSKVVV